MPAVEADNSSEGQRASTTLEQIQQQHMLHEMGFSDDANHDSSGHRTQDGDVGQINSHSKVAIPQAAPSARSVTFSEPEHAWSGAGSYRKVRRDSAAASSASASGSRQGWWNRVQSRALSVEEPAKSVCS